MNELRIKSIIKRAKEKMTRKSSIKDEVYVLSSIYDYIKSNNSYRHLLPLFEEELHFFKLYQDKYAENIRQKKLSGLKLQKVNEYKMIWDQKNFFYKLIHRNLSPNNNDLAHMVHEDIDLLIGKIAKRKQKIIHFK